MTGRTPAGTSRGRDPHAWIARLESADEGWEVRLAGTITLRVRAKSKASASRAAGKALSATWPAELTDAQVRVLSAEPIMGD